MTDRTPKPGRGAVYWLTAQSVLFGLVAALLGVVANAMFLDAYGPEWLPVTYIVIGAAGALVSALIARMAQSYNLVRIAVVVLTSVAVVFLATWVVAGDGDAAWVSAPLLVMFPILIQLGFVFIGAQAGRILDIAGIKERFPRIMAGFPVGAIIGGLVAAPLVGILGRTEGLLLVTALAQAAFAALVLVTGIRYAAFLAVDPTAPTPPVGGPDQDADAAPGIRQLLATRFVGLILGYQVLAALSSQLSEYLVLDRAAAQFEGAADLARFIAGYTAVMNVVSIVFLAVVAGPLMRRFGLRLGIAINPAVLTVCAVGMIAVLAVTGSASVALLVMVSTARILDIALTDGTTRTSINAMYQVLPERTRLSAQATIEGMGVPVAIAVSGVLVIVLNALPWSLPALIVTTTVVSAVWVWVGVLLYRSYGPALVDALRQHRLLVPTTQVEGTGDDLVAAGQLLESPDPRSARLGLELVSALAAPALVEELEVLAGDSRVEVRLSALEALASSGDKAAPARLEEEVREAALDDDPAVRVRAAHAARVLDESDRLWIVERLLADEAPEVRSAALDAVQEGDHALVPAVIRAVDDPLTTISACDAVGRLGDATLRATDQVLQRAAFGGPESAEARRATRLVRAIRTMTPTGDEILLKWAGHPDREVGLVVLERLARPGPVSPEGAQVLDAVLGDDLEHALRVLGAVVALGGERFPSRSGDPIDVPAEGDGPLRVALADEMDLLRDRVVAALVARHGRDRLAPVTAGLLATDGPAPLAVEALDVLLGSAEAGKVTPVVDPGPSPADRLRRLRAATGAGVVESDPSAVLRDMVEDRGDVWRSAWVRACAVHAAVARGIAAGLDVAPGRALGDPVVDEELDLIRR